MIYIDKYAQGVEIQKNKLLNWQFQKQLIFKNIL